MTLRVLVSYHYHRDTDLAQLVNELGGNVDLFADSGAYSAATSGATINLVDYAAWLTHWAPLFTVRSNMDVIGDHAGSAANFTRLRDWGVDVLPVFHAGQPWRVLEKLCEQHPYVALGGIALHAVGAAKQKALMKWLVKAFLIAREYGTVFHGFGLTSANLIRALPFYSVDSSSYTMGQRFGLVYLWDARNLRMHSVFFRNPTEVRPRADLFRQHGLPAARVLDDSFMRAGTAHHHTDRALLTGASARAYGFMEQSLTSRHRVPAPPLPRHADTGTKVYLALGGTNHSDMDPLRLLAKEHA
ncbi:hypothetical protein [Streptomyces alfalfae]|uniref:hypothetical protein n=1 Tax=Streptomyces alfalfae TaxID=1642299 RepID=UPI00281205B4|nr:hypothetical protein [Streptomyces alfalfae]